MKYALILIFSYGEGVDIDRLDGYPTLEECQLSAKEAKRNYAFLVEEGYSPHLKSLTCVPMPKGE